MSQVSQEVFDKIRARFSDIQMGDAEGKSVLDPDEAVFFEFNFDVGEDTLGSVVINLTENDSMKVYFSANILDKADNHQSQRWFQFLQNLRRFAYQNMMNFEVKNINKQRLDKKDFEFMSKIDHAEALTMESKMYGTKKTSKQKLGDAKVKVYHKKAVDEDKPGARSRYIKSVYIENAEGERFKFPSKNLPAARAMARHVSNGGYPNDEVGSHIMEMVNEMMELREFVRKARTSKYQSEDAVEVIDAARSRYQALRETIRSLGSKRGYSGYVENFQPDLIEVEEDDIDDLKERLTRSVFDERLEKSLGAVGKAFKMKQQQVQEQDNQIDRLLSSNEPIEVSRDPSSDQEISRFMQQVKSSDMPKDAQFRGIVTKIVEELANRVKDNDLAVALSRMDMNNMQDFKKAAKIAMKFVNGQVKSAEPVREINAMEAYERRLNMLAEGTWALPDTNEAINRLVDIVSNGLEAGENGENATSALYDLIGDDELFDQIEEVATKDGPESDVKPLVIARLKEFARMNPDNFTNPRAHDMVKKALRKVVKGKEDNGEQPEEKLDENVSPQDFVKSLKKQGWSIYASRVDHGVEKAHRLEFEKDGQEFEIIGKDDHWEVFTGPTMSGRGQEFNDLQSAFAAATSVRKVVKGKEDNGEQPEEKLDEKLDCDDDAGEWIDDFQNSDDERFDGKSKEKRKDMALGAYYDQCKEDEETDEQIQEQIDALYATINFLSNAGFAQSVEAKMNEVEALQKKLAERAVNNADEETINETNADLESIKKLAGVGSMNTSGTLAPGEDGYSVTPRSIIARQMLKDKK